MVHPVDPLHITLNDLKDCKQGHIVLFMLVDCNAFWQYDNVRGRTHVLHLCDASSESHIAKFSLMTSTFRS